MIAKRALLPVLVVLWMAGSARAEVDWTGPWKVDGDERARMLVLKGYSTTLTRTMDVGGASVQLEGIPRGEKLVLEGRLGGKGIDQAVESVNGAPAKEAVVHEVVLDVVAHEDKASGETRAHARLSVDDVLVKEEDWVQSASDFEIADLCSVDRRSSEKTPLGTLRPARQYLSVSYSIRHRSLRLVLRIEALDDRARAFYETQGCKKGKAGTIIYEEDLGVQAPADVYGCNWDSRDGTAAQRLALAGQYELFLTEYPSDLKTAVHEREGGDLPPPDAEVQGPPGLERCARFDVAPPELVLLGDDGGWGASPSSGYDVERPSSWAQARDQLGEAAFVIIAAPSKDRSLEFDGGSMAPNDIGSDCLGDLHVAILLGDDTGASDSGRSLIDQFVEAGCDVAIGFSTVVDAEEEHRFAWWVATLLERGDSVFHCARAAARQTYRSYLVSKHGVQASDLTEDEIDADLRRAMNGATDWQDLATSMRVALSPGIQPDEPLNPPRYGDHSNTSGATPTHLDILSEPR